MTTHKEKEPKTTGKKWSFDMEKLSNDAKKIRELDKKEEKFKLMYAE